MGKELAKKIKPIKKIFQITQVQYALQVIKKCNIKQLEQGKEFEQCFDH